MNCGVSRGELRRFLEEDGDVASRGALAEHVTRCPDCTRALDEMTGLDESIEWRPLQDAAPAPPPDDEARRSLERLHESLPSPPPCFPGSHDAEALLGSLGQFQVQALIGAGSYGFVYRAHDTKLDRPVALKVLAPDLARQPAVVARFEDEARAAARVKNPHVVIVHDVPAAIAEFPYPFFVMEFVDGPSLAKVLAVEGPLDPRRAAEYGRQAALGLAAAHGRGLVHRDVKPANLLLDKDQIKVADFGVNRAHDGPRRAGGSVLGTPDFMSPEQFNDPTNVDPRSDIYNLGGTLYQLVTGRLPFEAAPDALKRQVVGCAPVAVCERVSGLHPDLNAIIMRCLEKGPEDRFDTAAELAEELRRFLADEPVLSRPAGRPEQTWRWCRRHRGWTALLTAVPLFLLLLTGVSVPLAVWAVRERNRGERTVEVAREFARELSASGVNFVALGERDKARQLLEKNLALHERLVEQFPEDPALRHDRAQARMNLGNWYLIDGEHAAALELYEHEQCEAELRSLFKNGPRPNVYRHTLAHLLDNKGRALLALRKPKEAEESHREALTHRHYLVKKVDQKKPEYRAFLASTLNHLANALQAGGHPDEAAGRYDEVIDILAGLAKEQPKVPSHREELANACLNLGQLYRTARPDEARKLFERAVRHHRDLYEESPQIPDYAAELAVGLVGLGDLDADQQQFGEALGWYDKAIEPLGQVWKRDHNHPLAMQQSAEAQAGRATCLLRLGPREEALKAADSAAESGAGPAVPADTLVRVARALALATAGDESRDANRRAADAVNLLRRAHEQRWFEDSDNLKLLDTGKDFDPLRPRQDFRQFRGELRRPD
ncbi:MAG TPA: serine/threonine-protein kinase [Gemmataceae bacterium]|nr:serine/threonine-protein kinase [Gemmataceae bacterium]